MKKQKSVSMTRTQTLAIEPYATCESILNLTTYCLESYLKSFPKYVNIIMIIGFYSIKLHNIYYG